MSIGVRTFRFAKSSLSPFGKDLCRDRACPCPNHNADSHPAKRDFAKLNKGCPYPDCHSEGVQMDDRRISSSCPRFFASLRMTLCN